MLKRCEVSEVDSLRGCVQTKADGEAERSAVAEMAEDQGR